MGIIFDLDQTIIDSQIALNERKNRAWPNVYSLIPRFTLYDGMIDLIDELNDKNIPMCIVTSSPSTYCQRVLSHHGIKIISKVCYHDTQKRKPHPEPILKAISFLKVPKEKIISVGDDPNDIIASKEAGVISVGAKWGSLNPLQLEEAQADILLDQVKHLREFIFDKYSL